MVRAPDAKLLDLLNVVGMDPLDPDVDHLAVLDEPAFAYGGRLTMSDALHEPVVPSTKPPASVTAPKAPPKAPPDYSRLSTEEELFGDPPLPPAGHHP